MRIARLEMATALAPTIMVGRNKEISMNAGLTTQLRDGLIVLSDDDGDVGSIDRVHCKVTGH
jgi:hypothetical protein